MYIKKKKKNGTQKKIVSDVSYTIGTDFSGGKKSTQYQIKSLIKIDE